MYNEAENKRKSNARYVAFIALKDVYENKGYSDIILNKYFKEINLKEKDKAFATRCVYGVLQWQRLLDYYIDKLSNKPVKKISFNLLILLRLGIYQLMFLDRVPERAAVYETVKVAHMIQEKKGSGFINGVLRNFTRKKKELKEPEDLSVKYSHPSWMVDLLKKSYGEEKAKEVCKVNNMIPAVFLRTNTLKTDRDELIKRLQQAGISSKIGVYPADAIKVNSLQGLEQTQLFKEGCFYIQDINSMVVSYLANPGPGQEVGDLCSSPGGKTTHMAQFMENQGKIVAVDIHAHRLRLVKENCKRLGISNVEIVEGDCRELVNFGYSEKFDVTLVDAPCSSLGVLRKQPELKWRIEKKDIESIVKLQKELLKAAKKVTRPGGKIIYSTCTINPGENENLKEEFLAENPDLKPLELSRDLSDEIIKASCKFDGETLLFLPARDGGDGFFMTGFEK